mmetsp:Transcript_21820/g.58800  ORF Transcript_21820/g.58800 Transcript_21820/m.58800 type:complete len:586 (+) Transcript_21820:16-1773(+)
MDSSLVRVNTARMSAKYYADAVHGALAELGWEEVNSGGACDLHWWDAPIRREDFAAVQPGRAINRFYGMVRLCRKVCLARQLAWLEELVGTACAVSPRTWCVPAELPDFARGAERQASTSVFIIKPDAGCQGEGIALVPGEEVARRVRALPTGAQAVVQAYIPRPLLLGGLKFDLRFYVLLCAARHPVEAYMCARGLARFATHAYTPPEDGSMGDLFAHLTNSTLNTGLTGVSNKRSWAHVHAKIGERVRVSGVGLDAYEGLWERIVRVAAVAVHALGPLAAELQQQALPAPAFSRYASFQILGVDVMLDEDLNAWLLEMNHSPSMALEGADEDERDAKVHAVQGALRLARAGQVDSESDAHVVRACSAHALVRLHHAGLQPSTRGAGAESQQHLVKEPSQRPGDMTGSALSLHGNLLQALDAAGAVMHEARAVFEAAASPVPAPRARFSAPAGGRTLSRQAFTALCAAAGVEGTVAMRVYGQCVSDIGAMGTGWAPGTATGPLRPGLPFHAFVTAIFAVARERLASKGDAAWADVGRARDDGAPREPPLTHFGMCVGTMLNAMSKSGSGRLAADAEPGREVPDE